MAVQLRRNRGAGTKDRVMWKRKFLLPSLMMIGASYGALRMAAQQPRPNDTVFRVDVNLVQLEVAVTDKKGNYITGLRPSDFTIFEDGIAQKIATFGDEKEPLQNWASLAAGKNTLPG